LRLTEENQVARKNFGAAFHSNLAVFAMRVTGENRVARKIFEAVFVRFWQSLRLTAAGPAPDSEGRICLSPIFLYCYCENPLFACSVQQYYSWRCTAPWSEGQGKHSFWLNDCSSGYQEAHLVKEKHSSLQILNFVAKKMNHLIVLGLGCRRMGYFIVLDLGCGEVN
jgi:hypothetical protein